MEHRECILIIDFGSQYTQLIARQVREEKCFSLIVRHDHAMESIRSASPTGIIFSGGPMSVFEEGAPGIEQEIYTLGIPILGICYGLQLMAKDFGGSVEDAEDREYGKASVKVLSEHPLFNSVKSESTVWMSHGTHVCTEPPGFRVIASSTNSPVAAIADDSRKFFGVQFHPEVYHTEEGKKIIRNFLTLCGSSFSWESSSFVEETVSHIQTLTGTSNVICALSGGVDSSVAAVLVKKAAGNRLFCIHIDNGLMRKQESETIVHILRDALGLQLEHVDASELFLSRLSGVSDPEQKRRIIGHTFIEVFEQEAKKIKDAHFLVQGTLYPDVIESVPVKGSSVTIKTHHNVGGLPEKMNFRLIEPLRELFKDEVRTVGRFLGISEDLLMRHPFPGPGLAVRVMGEITKEKLEILREADAIYIEELKNFGLYGKIWQAFAVLLPVISVGVMGDARTYQHVIALRAVTSRDGMTADWYPFEHGFLAHVSNRICNSVHGVNRVVYDISSKPPSTIEWE